MALSACHLAWRLYTGLQSVSGWQKAWYPGMPSHVLGCPVEIVQGAPACAVMRVLD